MAISKTAVYSGAWTAIRNAIRDNLTDPKNRPHFKERIIRSHTPKPSGTDHPGFPFIVIRPVELAQSEISFKATASQLDYVCIIEVFGKDNPADVDALSDNVVTALMAGINDLSADGVKSLKIDTSTSQNILLDGGEAWLRVIGLNFKTRLDLNG
jgi:hypothetical protein